MIIHNSRLLCVKSVVDYSKVGPWLIKLVMTGLAGLAAVVVAAPGVGLELLEAAVELAELRHWSEQQWDPRLVF